MQRLIKYLPFLSFLMPVFVFAAAGTADFGILTTAVSGLQNVVDALIPVVVALALLGFFWGVFTYFILGAGSEEKRETGKKYMLYGLVGLILIVAVWGIIQAILTLFGLDTGSAFKAPKIGP